MKYCNILMLMALSALGAPETETRGVNPVHQLYLDLKAEGLSLYEIADRVASSEEMRTAILAYPLEDCYTSSSNAFARDVKTCGSMPKPQQSACYSNAQTMRMDSNKTCGVVYGTAALFHGNTGGSNSSSSAQKPAPQPQKK